MGSYDASLAIDLDDDGDLEVVTCGGAVHHDGTVAWTKNIGYGYPQAADFDDDGEPEILCTTSGTITRGSRIRVVTNYNIDGNFQKIKTAPTVQVVRDEQDRWIRARRIWNQPTYHVTNVREAGTIPEVEPHHWETLNVPVASADRRGRRYLQARARGLSPGSQQSGA